MACAWEQQPIECCYLVRCPGYQLCSAESGGCLLGCCAEYGDEHTPRLPSPAEQTVPAQQRCQCSQGQCKSSHVRQRCHRSNRAHLTLAAWTSAIWDSSMSASRRSLDGVPPIVQNTPPTRKRGKSLAGQQRRCNGHSLAWCKLCKHDRAAGLGGNRGDCRHRLMPRPNTGMQSETGIKDFLSLVR